MGHQLNANEQNRHSSSELPSISTLLDRALVKRPPLVEGETSFKTQALHASQVEELKSPAAQQSPTFVQELANLKDALQDQETSGLGKGNVKSGQLEQAHVPDVKIPPPTSVMQLLQLMADERHTNLVLFNFWGVQNLESFRHLCKSTYFNTEPLTLTEKTSFNGTVSLILREIGTEDRPNIEPGVLSRLQDLCEKNFWEGVETYQVMSIATEEHVHILFLAVVLVSSMGTLPLQWSLTTANLDCDDLKLLQDVLHTLENIGLDLQFSQKLFKLCKALCRIAEAFLEHQVPLTNIVADASNTAHSLPQGPLPDTWSWLGSQITDPNAVGDFDLDNLDETFFGHGF
ncbi:hypothetical protein BFJ65_g6471 [Fusarium oxysporum f. sp. cepae]|uniref:Uncharacterized protein n=1 Tax=Fusarium oxysporum f. sp. cepae TaxID=396571 RepID=A0A3L6NPT0_FUSOX|nr:hypothetical protein BFJ65_g6471 [Fusarium oxysporum f. sp. cepae]